MIYTKIRLHDGVNIQNQKDRGEITIISGDHGEIETTIDYGDDVGLYSLITSLLLSLARDYGYAYRDLMKKVDQRLIDLIEEMRIQEKDHDL